jgi:hypothetical protein
MTPVAEPRGRRKNNKPWKHIYGVDRRYTARVDRVREREAARVWAAIEADPVAVARIDAGLADLDAGRRVPFATGGPVHLTEAIINETGCEFVVRDYSPTPEENIA